MRFKVHPVRVHEKRGGVTGVDVMRKCWFWVYVHPTRKAFRAKLKQPSDTRALFMCDTRWHADLDDWGRAKSEPKGALGSLHFCAKDVDIGVIAHECTHAMFHLARRTSVGLELWGPSQREEAWAYNLQQLVEGVIAKLVTSGVGA